MNCSNQQRKTLHIIGDGAASVTFYLEMIRLYKHTDLVMDIVWHTSDPETPLPSLGVAYGATADQLHFLNSEVHSMSIPGYMSFVEWVTTHRNEILDQYSPFITEEELEPESVCSAFLPRRVYREYLQYLLDITPLPMLWNRRLTNRPFDPQITCSGPRATDQNVAYVWCVGAKPKILHDTHCEVSQPWTHSWQDTKDRQNILIYGSGLTAIDAAISAFWAAPADRKPKITLASRSGRLPLPYAPSEDPDQSLLSRVQQYRSVRELIRIAREVNASGHWNTFMKAMRPYWTQVWGSFNEQEQRRAMRVMPFFDIHRHKIVPPIQRAMDVIGSNLEVRKLEDVNPESYDLRVNATGIDFNPNRNPTLRQASISLQIDMDHGPWGFTDATTRCRIGPNSWCIGAYMKQTLGEATAMPEIKLMSHIVSDSVFQHFTRSSTK